MTLAQATGAILSSSRRLASMSPPGPDGTPLGSGVDEMLRQAPTALARRSKCVCGQRQGSSDGRHPSRVRRSFSGVANVSPSRRGAGLSEIASISRMGPHRGRLPDMAGRAHTRTANVSPRRRRYETLQSAADRLAVDTRTVRRWIAAGRLKAYRTGPRLLRVDIDEVDSLLTPVPNFAGTDTSTADDAWPVRS